jgi:hypothetical protein
MLQRDPDCDPVRYRMKGELTEAQLAEIRRQAAIHREVLQRGRAL